MLHKPGLFQTVQKERQINILLIIWAEIICILHWRKFQITLQSSKFISFYVERGHESEWGGDSVQAAPSNSGKSADKLPTKYVQGQHFLCAI